MMYYAIINIQARVERYTTRGFQQPEAEILVLLEECASGLFSAFPDPFRSFPEVPRWFFFTTVRLSRDLDLLATAEDLRLW